MSEQIFSRAQLPVGLREDEPEIVVRRPVPHLQCALLLLVNPQERDGIRRQHERSRAFALGRSERRRGAAGPKLADDVYLAGVQIDVRPGQPAELAFRAPLSNAKL